MKLCQVILALLVALLGDATAYSRSSGRQNPLTKAVELLKGLAEKIEQDTRSEAKAYSQYTEWCDNEAHNFASEVKVYTKKKEKLEAFISKATSEIEVDTAKINELASNIAAGNAQLDKATSIRAKEHASFLTAEEETTTAMSAVERAVLILSKESSKAGDAENSENPAFMQVDTTSLQRLTKSLSAVLDAASLSSADQDKLIALIQAGKPGKAAGDSEEDVSLSQASMDEELGADEASLGAPDEAVYQSHGAGILDVLDDLRSKAESDLFDLRGAEATAEQNFKLLEQSLQNSLKADTGDLAEQKADRAEAEEAKASGEGNLEVCTEALAASSASLKNTQKACMEIASDRQMDVQSRKDELSAIAKAMDILAGTGEGAEKETYDFLQVRSTSRQQVRLPSLQAAEIVRKLAKRYRSSALAQLSSRIAAVLRLHGRGGGDPLEKVRGLIGDLIDRLTKEGQAEAGAKAYCDEMMAKTEEKKGDLEDSTAKLSSKIERASSMATSLEMEVRQLQLELATLMKGQTQIEEIRTAEHKSYVKAKADLEQGISAIKKALMVLKDYYGTGTGEMAMIQEDESRFGAFMQQPGQPARFQKSQGAGDQIVGILEVIESDFAKSLANEEELESDSAAEYDKETQENAVIKAEKEKDVAHKQKEFKYLGKTLSELSSDKDTANSEYAGVLEYYNKLKDRCIAKPEAYKERRQRREREIAGLREALSAIEGETVLAQRGSGTSTLRR